MNSITIPDIDQDLETKLRRRAAERDRSVEDEAREILRSVLAEHPEDQIQDHLIDRIRRRVEALGGFELELPPRGPDREPPSFS